MALTEVIIKMLHLSVIATFLVCAYGAVLAPVSALDGRIAGGSLANITEAPYQVSLLQDDGNRNFEHVCGGSIISRSVIVTAAHCTNATTANQWKVRAGSSINTAGGQVIQVTKIVQHNAYNNKFDNDIALLFLGSQLELRPGVGLIPLATQGQDIPDNSSAFVTGWGLVNEGGVQSINLRKVIILVVNQQQCIDAYAGYNTITANMICAGRLGVGGQDACQMDDGGPLAVNGVLVGITSWGRGCGQAQFHGVWVRVPALRSWIDNNL